MENPEATGLAAPEIPPLSLSLYVHVPFCAGKCLYCDFFSVPRGSVDEKTAQAVISQTVEQARFFLDLMARGRGLSLDTLYVGGGTPSALSQESLGALLGEFGATAWREWTVEANPESLDAGFLDACGRAGVSRLSLGIQSMSEALLRLLGRPGSRADSEKALQLVRAQWPGEVSLDFIAGIPGQSVGQLREDLGALDAVGAGHASLYSLTVEPGTGLADRVEDGSISLNDPECDEDLWFAGKDALEQRGFENYEISNFCRPGKASLHNLRYWNLEAYLGVGPGAVSTLPSQCLAGQIPVTGTVCRLSCPENINEFLIGREKLWGMRVEEIQPQEFLVETLMMGLRLAEGIPAGRLEYRFSRCFDELFPGLWQEWVQNGLALPVDERLRLSEGGRLILDPLMAEIARRVHEGALPPLDVRWP